MSTDGTGTLAPLAQVSEVKDIPLEQLEIGRSQVRTRELDEDIEELAISIEKIGLIEPIVVAPVNGANEENRYEIITGQRRFFAHVRLQKPTIRATVLRTAVDPDIAKAISLTENLIRKNLTTKEYVDACTALYKKYGSVQAVSEKVGIPHYKVSQYVKFDQLVEPLKEMVNQGLRMDVALRAQKAATDPQTKIPNDEAALIFAQEMQRMSGLQQRQVGKVAAENPNAPIEEILSLSRKPPKQISITIIVGERLNEALNGYANDERISKGDAILSLLESGLTDLGYLKQHET